MAVSLTETLRRWKFDQCCNGNVQGGRRGEERDGCRRYDVFEESNKEG